MKGNGERKPERKRKSWDYNIMMDIREIHWQYGRQRRS
jgi:hypothetical protein